jgi:hypothetical protein
MPTAGSSEPPVCSGVTGDLAVTADRTISSERNLMNRGAVLCRSAVSRYRLLLPVLALVLIPILVAGCGPNKSTNNPKPSQSTSQVGY